MIGKIHIKSSLLLLTSLAWFVPCATLAQETRPIDLHFGKKNLPSIEVHIGAVKRAQQRLAREESGRPEKISGSELKDIQERELENLDAYETDAAKHAEYEAETREAIEKAQREIEDADQFHQETRRKLDEASSDVEKQSKISEEERKRLALERVKSLTESIKKRQHVESKKISVASESTDVSEADIDQEVDINIDIEENSELPRSMRDQNDISVSRATGKESSEDVVEFSSDKLNDEESDFSHGIEDDNGMVSDVTAPVKIIELKSLNERDSEDSEADESEEPKLSNVPQLDRSKISIDPEEDFPQYTERKDVRIEEREEAHEEDAVAKQRPSVPASMAKKFASMQQSAPVIRTPVPPPASIVAEKKAEKKKTISADKKPAVVKPKIEEKKEVAVEQESEEKNEESENVDVVLTIPPQPDAGNKSEQSAEAEPVIINIPSKDESSADRLSIASMFSKKQDEYSPIPQSLRKKYEASSQQPAQDSSGSENENLAPPASILPSGLAGAGSSVKTEIAATQQPEKTEVAKVEATSPAPQLSNISSSSGALVSINFTQDATDVSADGLGDLNKIIDQLKSNPQKRLSIVGYAGNPDDTSSTARRISLKRALAVRKRIVDSGIESTRINVQALGNQVKEGSTKDRVDVFFIGEKS